jgi:hypothetical protein
MPVSHGAPRDAFRPCRGAKTSMRMIVPQSGGAYCTGKVTEINRKKLAEANVL